jgi:hypothetical protein
MNYRTYFRNAEELYMMELVMPQLDNVIFESRQRVGTYMIFDSGNYIYRIQFDGSKHNMNKFTTALAFLLINISIDCDIDKRKVLLR